MVYGFLLESTTIEKKKNPYKTASSKAKFKINRIRSKVDFRKEWSFANNSFIFFENLILL